MLTYPSKEFDSLLFICRARTKDFVDILILNV